LHHRIVELLELFDRSLRRRRTERRTKTLVGALVLVDRGDNPAV